MENVDIVGLVFLVGFLIIPALGFTASFVIRPIVDAIIQLRAAFPQAGTPLSEQRIASLEAELRAVNAHVLRLEEQVSFDRQLTSGG